MFCLGRKLRWSISLFFLKLTGLCFFHYYLLSDKCHINYAEDLCLMESELFLIESAALGVDLIGEVLICCEYRNSWVRGVINNQIFYTHSFLHSHKHSIMWYIHTPKRHIIANQALSQHVAETFSLLNVNEALFFVNIHVQYQKRIAFTLLHPPELWKC